MTPDPSTAASDDSPGVPEAVDGSDRRVTAGLPPDCYFDESVHAREMQDVFQKQWIFVGLKRQLSGHQDYLARTVGGVPIVIQNFHGELRALHNVCSHRHSRIRTADSGCGPLQCPYHGWTYDAWGVPVGIPGNREHFGFSEEQKVERALRRFELDQCGEFLFVRLSPGAIGLSEQLGSYAELLSHLSEHFGKTVPIDEQSIPWETNWKIGVESVLEAYHVATVHHDSFQPLLAATLHHQREGDHTSTVSLLREEVCGWWDKAARRLKLHRSPRFENYDHFSIFPNLAIGLTRGSLMSLQTYEPVTATRSVLRYQMLLANVIPDMPVDAAIARSVTDSIVDSNRTILNEDRVASELVQQGLRHACRRATLGINEGRIRVFHEALLRHSPDIGNRG